MKNCTFLLILLLVLSLIEIRPSIGFCSDGTSEISEVIYWHIPDIGIDSQRSADIFIGNCDLSQKVISPIFDNNTSISIIAHPFVPAKTSNSKDTSADAWYFCDCGSRQIDPILIEQFWIFNNLSLVRFGQSGFTIAMPLSKAQSPNTTDIAIETKLFQDNQANIQIPSEYIFYKWTLFIIVIFDIIEAIFRLLC